MNNNNLFPSTTFSRSEDRLGNNVNTTIKTPKYVLSASGDREFDELICRELTEFIEKLPCKEDQNKLDCLIGLLQLYLHIK